MLPEALLQTAVGQRAAASRRTIVCKVNVIKDPQMLVVEAWEYSVGKCSRMCGQGDVAAEDAIG